MADGLERKFRARAGNYDPGPDLENRAPNHLDHIQIHMSNTYVPTILHNSCMHISIYMYIYIYVYITDQAYQTYDSTF